MLRGYGVIHAAKRTQEVSGPCDGASKSDLSWEPTPSDYEEGNILVLMALYRDPTGVKEQGTLTLGSPGTWEILPPPLQNTGPGGPETKPLAHASFRCAWMGVEETSGSTVSMGEGNGALGDGRQEVGASHSTEEAGELAPEDPVEGRGRRVMNF